MKLESRVRIIIKDNEDKRNMCVSIDWWIGEKRRRWLRLCMNDIEVRREELHKERFRWVEVDGSIDKSIDIEDERVISDWWRGFCWHSKWACLCRSWCSDSIISHFLSSRITCVDRLLRIFVFNDINMEKLHNHWMNVL